MDNSRIKSFFEFIDRHKNIIEIVFRVIEIFIIGGFGIYITAKANSITTLQLRLSEAESRPLLTVREEQDKNENGFYDTNKIVISNESGYMTNYHSDTISFLHITTNLYGDYQEIDIPVIGFWTINAFSGNMIGIIESKWEYKNNEKLLALMNKVRSIVDSDYGSMYFYNIELRTYLKITYKDILEKSQTMTYEVKPIYGTFRIEETEYQENKERYALLEEFRIDLSDIDGEQLIHKTELLIQSNY